MTPQERFREMVISCFVEVDRVVTIAGDFGDGSRIVYRVDLEALERHLTVVFSIGPDVPLSGHIGPDVRANRPSFWHSGTASAVAARRRIRERYCPNVVDVVRSVLLDIASTDGCADWAEWAVEMGDELRTVDDIRESQQAYALIVSAFRPWAEQVFGPDFSEAIKLAGAGR